MDRLKNGFIQTVILLLLASIGTLYVVLNNKSVVKNQSANASAFGCLCPSDYVLRSISCIESGGINYVDTTKNEVNCNYCGWSWANGFCCPSGGDSCSNIGAIKCDENPRVLECKVWNSACPMGVWVTIQSYGTLEELYNDSRCGGEAVNPPIETPIPTPTQTPVPTPTPTPTATPTITPTPTATPISSTTPTPIPTATPTPTNPPGEPNSCNGTCGSSVSTPTPPPVLGATAPPALPKTGGGIEALLSLLGMGGFGIYFAKRYRLV